MNYVKPMLRDVPAHRQHAAKEAERASLERDFHPRPSCLFEARMQCPTLPGERDVMAAGDKRVAQLQQVAAEAAGVGAGREVQDAQGAVSHASADSQLDRAAL